MNKIKVAITGGIGSGKSTAASCIASLGYTVYSCDEIYKELIETEAYIQKIKTLFPTAVKNGKIDKKNLSELVFQDSEKRKQLNAVAHPLVMNELKKRINDCEETLVFAEVPLLFEGNFENLFDQVIVMQRKKENRVSSVMDRDGVSAEDVKKRIQAQFDYDSEKGRMRLQKINVHFVFNNGSIDDLSIALKNLISQF